MFGWGIALVQLAKRDHPVAPTSPAYAILFTGTMFRLHMLQIKQSRFWISHAMYYVFTYQVLCYIGNETNNQRDYTLIYFSLMYEACNPACQSHILKLAYSSSWLIC